MTFHAAQVFASSEDLRGVELSVHREATRARVLAGGGPSVRHYNRAVPRDLATVLVKAMDRDPARRYPSISAFAADLDRVRQRLPIAARPPGSLLRLSRWCQRHPALATGLTLGFVLTAGTPTAIALGIAGQRDLALAAEGQAQLRAYEANVAAVNAALQAHYVEEARRRLEACPDALRGFEWRHLAMALDGSIATLRGGTAAVTAVAMTADGQVVAAADAHGDVLRWQPEVDPAPRRLGKHDTDIEQLAFVADGRELLAVTKRGRVLRLDSDTGQQLAERVPDGQVAWFRLQDDGRLFVSTGDWRVAQLDPRTLAAAAHYQLERSGLPPRGEFAVVGQHVLAPDVSRGMRAWQLSDGRAAGRVACSAVGQLAAAGGRVAIVDGHGRVSCGTGALPALHPLDNSDTKIRTIALEPRGELLFGLGTDRNLYVWRLRDGARVAALSGAPRAGPLAVAGRRLLLATGAPDGSVQLWSPFGGDARQEVPGNDGVISQLGVTCDGELISGSHSAAMLSWDHRTGEPRRLYAPLGHWATGLAITADGAHFYAGWHGNVVRFATAMEPLRDLWPLDTGVHALTAAEPGMLLAATDRGGLLLDGENGTVRTTFAHGGPVLSCAFTPDGRHAFTGGMDGRVVRWLVSNAGAGFELAPGSGPVCAMIVAGEHLLVANGSGVGALDVVSGRVRWEQPSSSPCLCLAMLSQPPRLVSGHGDGLLVFWEPGSGRALLTLRLGTGAIRALAADPAGDWIAAGGDAELIYVLRAAAPEPSLAAALRRADARRAVQETFALHRELAVREDVLAAIAARDDLDATWRQRMQGYQELWLAPSWGTLVTALETAAVPGQDPARYQWALRVAKAAWRWPNDTIAPAAAALAHARLREHALAVREADAGLQRRGPAALDMAPALHAARALALVGLGRREEAADARQALQRAIAAVEHDARHVWLLAEVEAALAR
jgi:WD40 repeat protein